jgi:phosphatidylserine/phosphatidylglycerophosphate/cardiolipin synthase-like enzyme
MKSLIESASSALLLVSFDLRETARDLVGSVADRASAGVRVTFCLDDEQGGVTVLRRIWPKGAPPPRLLVPNRKVWPKGHLHAKVIVADTRRALITSANLTGPGVDSNLEVGVMVAENVARDLHRYMMTLLRSGVLAEKSLGAPET